MPFSQDFAQSCNTAFISLADRLAPDALPAPRRDYGLGREPPEPAAPGRRPPRCRQARTRVERAAAMIGQHEILASPMSMAGVAARSPPGAGTRHACSPPIRGAPGPALPPGERDTLAA